MVYRYQREVRKRFEDAYNAVEVLKGVDSWYFYTGNEMLEDFIGRNLRTTHELSQWVQSYRDKKEWLEKRGIRYLLIVAPNKSNIYSEFVGPPWNENRGASRLTQIKQELTRAERSALLDLTPALRKLHDTDTTLYFKSDTHWTSYGAFLAYQAIADKIESFFPETHFKRNFPISPVVTRKCDPRMDKCGGLTNMLLDFDSFEESYRELEPFPRCAQEVSFDLELSNLREGHEAFYFHTRCQQRKLKAVVFRDSFFGDLVPYFSENFKDVI